MAGGKGEWAFCKPKKMRGQNPVLKNIYSNDIENGVIIT